MDRAKKAKSGQHVSRAAQRTIFVRRTKKNLAKTYSYLKLQAASLQALAAQLITKFTARFPVLRNLRVRIGMSLAVAVLVLAEIITMVQPYFVQHTYALGNAGSLLAPISEPMAGKLKYDEKEQAFTFNSGYTQPTAGSAQTSGQQISATAYENPKKGVVVTDTANKINFTLTPKFGLATGKKDGNRVVYPLRNGNGWAVYTMTASGVKEDILLNQAKHDTMALDYTLGIDSGMQARLEKDGGIGVYGNTIFSGNVATGSEKDAALLQKARANAPKSTLLFTIPKPTIVESDKKNTGVKAAYTLSGSNLRVTVTGLKQAHYPLSIDPSIYVVTAQQFMNGNNETNIDFDVSNKLIKKGRTTGARFDTWNTTTDLPISEWGGGAVAAGGYVYSVGGSSFDGQIYTSQGSDTFTVPAGITSITIKAWGGGGGGGGGGNGSTGGAGGGGGGVTATIPVSGGEVLDVYVGGGGAGGLFNNGGNDAGGGGGGGGYSSLYRASTPLVVAAGGGGGGGARQATNGGAAGAGGGTTGQAGVAVGNGGAGGAGTPTTGGAGGTGGGNPGSAGTSLTGGAGADGRTNAGADGSGVAGGLATGGHGGQPNVNTTRPGGGGGGSGYFGGGGGGATTNATGNAGGGGGGGSSYTVAGATGVTNAVGNRTTPGNDTDTARNGAAGGGAGGATLSTGAPGSNGTVVITYGSGGMSVSPAVNWAQFNTTTGTIDSANPGNGTCSGWCTTAAYNLPGGRANFSLVAYNGFLYAFGGTNAACTAGNGTGVTGTCNTVYTAKLGANGEPRLWHPTDTNPNNWVYWYRDANLTTERAFTSAVAYNNRMYLLGGRTASAPVNTVQIADINPTGTLGTWTTSGASLPSNLYGHNALVYNDNLYIVGGAVTVGGAPSNSVYYIKINGDGTLNNWIQTTSFASGRMSWGGTFTSMWGAYIYINGGCSAVNGSGYCTTVQSDAQVASINADGSLDVWNGMAGLSDQRIGASMLAWRSNIYSIGGCSAQNSSTGDCSTTLSSIKYGVVNQDGDASTVDQSVASGTAPCSGTTPSSCNLPGSANIGNMLSATVITNGYLYVIGGCTNDTCSTTMGNVAYVAISSTGIMTKPATCPSGAYQGGAWCVDTVHVVTGGIAASAPVVFGGRIYLVGGLDGNSNINEINYTSVNADGSIAGWATPQTMTGVGAVSESYLFAYARANPAQAATNPGNLYIFGGCSTSSAAGCTAYGQGVYKCNIQAAGAIAGCATTGQMQIGIVPGDTQVGLGIMSGTVYANYIYLIGGVTPNQVDLKTMRYAKFDDSNNVVSANGSGAWVQSDKLMLTGRRRSAAFGYNGYIYVVGGFEGTTGVLADIEFVKVNVSDGSLGTPTEGVHQSAVTINQRWGLSVAVSNSYAYVIGGCTVGTSPGGCSNRTDIIQTFQVYNNDSGTPAGYSTGTNIGVDTIGGSSAILNNYIYHVGGCITAVSCASGMTNKTYYAPINVNGVIGTWLDASTNGGTNLPASLAWGKLVTAGGSLYYLGGQTGAATTTAVGTIYYTTGFATGSPTWSASAATRGIGDSGAGAQARTQFGAAVWNNRIYVLGGYSSGGTVQNTVYSSPQLNSGGNIAGTWTTGATSPSNAVFDVARSGLSVVAYANNLYVLGGYDGTNYLSDTQYAQINSANGSVGTWTFSASLPRPLAQGDAFAANGYMYIIGGRSAAATCDPVTLTAPISANTTIASGNNPTGVGEWYQTNQAYVGSRYGSSAAYLNGKAYVMGGGCSAFVAAADRTYSTALLSQPQVAKYSIAIDTDSDVYPNRWLLNGLDNSIGARWQLKYRSMTNTTTLCKSPAMTTWGAETNFGNVTLGLPGVYTPKDSGGATTNCARFFYFNVTVDSSQAFGYPDDVTRGPTITDLTLQFTADPAKRLMHGRTFTGGLQMPDDTPYYAY